MKIFITTIGAAIMRAKSVTQIHQFQTTSGSLSRVANNMTAAANTLSPNSIPIIRTGCKTSDTERSGQCTALLVIGFDLMQPSAQLRPF
jgi:hypothetical protein